MPVLAEILMRAEQRLTKGLADTSEGDEISLLTVSELLMRVKTLKTLPRRLAGLRTQDEPSQQQDLNLCPDCRLIAMFGPIARAPPIGNKQAKHETGIKKSVFLTPNLYSNLE